MGEIMQTKAMLRSLVAVAVATSIAACGDKPEEVSDLVVEQEQQTTEQQTQNNNYSNSGGTDPMPPTAPEASVTEQLTIAVPDGAYPFNAAGENKFYYGLDEAEVTFPEGAVMLDFSEDPVAALSKAIDDVQKAINAAEDPTTVNADVVLVMPEGSFTLDRTFNIDMSVWPDIESLTIYGHGIDKTEISYTGVESAAAKDGFLISNAKNVELAHFTVTDSSNNAIKVTKTDGVYMHHLGTIWPGDPDSGNGAYGLYPVETTNVIVEDSFSYGSADAGVYVGQSEDIVVRRNFAVANVAGIEIENSRNADVYDNYAYMNTAGVLIFDLPIGNNKYGRGTRIFRNVAVSNNTDNFANASANPAGVHIAPPGSGVIVLSTSDVEIFDNDISGNESYAVAISSYFLAEQDFAKYADPNGLGGVVFDGWKPVPRAINIHSNRITNTGNNPRGKLLEDETLPIIKGFEGIRGMMPAILYDGLGANLAEIGMVAGLGEHPFKPEEAVCAKNNGGATVGEVFDHTGAVPADLSGATLPPFNLDLTGENLLDCELTELPVYTAKFKGVEYGCGADDTGASCTDNMPTPSRTDELIIPVPKGSYPDVAGATESFYYGLDAVTVTIPEGAVQISAEDFTADAVTALSTVIDTKNSAIAADANESTELVVVMPEGKFDVNRTFNIDMSDYANITKLTIMGHGISKTMISYTNSDEVLAKDGFLISNANNIEMAHFSVEDSKNNAIKLTKSNGVWLHDLGTIWPGDPDKANGAYGLYPVESTNILVEDTFTFGSADAGVYVGQSEDIVVRRNFAIQNVAGIEIENSKRADVYDNYAYKNTAGLLIFDLPIGNQKYGSGVRVFNNTSVANNTDNFANASANPAGVHIAPPGSGIIVLATSDVEIFDNKLVGNESYAVAVSSYFLAESDFAKYQDPTNLGGVLMDGWKPIPRSINIHDNEVAENATNPRGTLLEDPSLPIKKGFFFVNGDYPDILYDGLGQNLAALGVTAAMGELAFTADDAICAKDNGEDTTSGEVFDHTAAIPADLTGATLPPFTIAKDLLECELTALPAYSATINNAKVGCGEDDDSASCN